MIRGTKVRASSKLHQSWASGRERNKTSRGFRQKWFSTIVKANLSLSYGNRTTVYQVLISDTAEFIQCRILYMQNSSLTAVIRTDVSGLSRLVDRVPIPEAVLVWLISKSPVIDLRKRKRQ